MWKAVGCQTLFAFCGKSDLLYDYLLYQGKSTQLNENFGSGASITLEIANHLQKPAHYISITISHPSTNFKIQTDICFQYSEDQHIYETSFNQWKYNGKRKTKRLYWRNN